MFYLLSQEKDRLQPMGRHALAYAETKEYGKRKSEEPAARHTLVVDDGVQDEIAEYDTKEDCLRIIEIIAFALGQEHKGDYVAELPPRDAVAQVWEEYTALKKQFDTAAQEVKSGIQELFEYFSR